MDALFRSFEENSIIWILISLGVGGVIGATIKLLFEQVFGPRVEGRRAARQALRAYSFPFLRAADALDAGLANLIRFADSGWFDEDEHYRISTLYLLASYFGWCKILEDAAFLEFQDLSDLSGTASLPDACRPWARNSRPISLSGSSSSMRRACVAPCIGRPVSIRWRE